MDMSNTKKVLGYVIFSFIFILSVLSPIYILLKEEDVKGVNIQKDIVSSYPYITNLMPKTVRVGEEYVFVPRVISEDMNSVVITMNEGPTWLYLEESLILRGIPSLEDVGTYKVVLNISDVYGSSDLIEYIIVEGDEE